MTKAPNQVLSRPPWERMMHLHKQLQANAFPNCPAVAATFEVTPRTILRDIEFMKDRMNLPIEYDPKRYGFRYTTPVGQFPGLCLDEAELFSLMVAQKAIAQYQGTPFHRPLETAFERLTAQLDSNTKFTLGNWDQALSFRPFAPEDTDVDCFRVLTKAMRERRSVLFDYKNLGAAAFQPRHVHPYHLACIENHWYLFAHDVTRKAMRTFVLTRMRHAKPGKEAFAVPPDFNPDQYLQGTFAAFKGDGDYEIVIEFDAWATDLLRGRKWHASQEVTDLPGGCSRLRMRLNSLEEMERWVLSWGTHATVIQPANLIERIAQTAKALGHRYETRNGF